MNEYTDAVIERSWEYRGYKCVVLMQLMGFRTGYVAIPKGHTYYCVDYNRIPVDCHGGLTYSDSTLIHTDDACVWWIGFDAGHFGDGFDFEAALTLFRDYPKATEALCELMSCSSYSDYSFTPRSLDYCIEQCENIVNQLIDLEEMK